jgi:16S rRNA (cytosine967-C5)-methyltransferase
MMADAEPMLKILGTDSRSSILKNFEERFKKIGIKNFETMQVDFTTDIPTLPAPDCILADVPCTGSGTWARTPEWLSMFNESSIDRFAILQRKITSNLTKLLRSGAYFVYITCSVFKEENETNIEWIEKNTELVLQKSGYIEGAEKGADTLFAARFMKN